MSGNSNLLRAMQMFSQGARQYNTERAIDDAQKELDTARLTYADEEGKLPENDEGLNAVRNRIAENLAGRLAGLGASGGQIQAATSFGLTHRENLARRDRLDAAEAKRSARAAAPAFTPKQQFDVTRDQQKFVRSLSQDFTSQTKDLREGIQSGMKAKKAIELGVENAAAAGSVKTMLAKALQPGNLTDREQAVFEGSPQLLNHGKRLYKKLVDGKGFTKEDQGILREYNNALMDANVNEFNKQKGDYISAQEGSLSALGIAGEALDKSLGRFQFKTSKEQAIDTYVNGLIRSGKLDAKKKAMYIEHLMLQEEANKK